MAKAVRARFVTPKGVAVFPRLDKPDTKFDAEGVYKTGLRLDPSDPEVAEFIHKLTAFAQANGKPIDKVGLKDESDDSGQPTGMVILNLKVKAKWPNGESRKPTIVDAGKQPFEGNVGGGSLIRISFEAATYDGFGGGVSCAPLAVQVLEAKTWSKGVDDFEVEADYVTAPATEDFDDSGNDEPEF